MNRDRSQRSGRGAVKTARPDRKYMVWHSLRRLSERAPQILEMLRQQPDELEDWHEHKLNLAAEYVDCVYDALKFSVDEEVVELAAKVASAYLKLRRRHAS